MFGEMCERKLKMHEGALNLAPSLALLWIGLGEGVRAPQGKLAGGALWPCKGCASVLFICACSPFPYPTL